MKEATPVEGPQQIKQEGPVDKPVKHEEEKKGGNNDNRSRAKGPKKQVKSHLPSTEAGFTGEPETWFDDIQFKKQLTQDLQYNNEKHDYYFGSYSHFYIHEEMLKD